jgi:hypothetical protein
LFGNFEDRFIDNIEMFTLFFIVYREYLLNEVVLVNLVFLTLADLCVVDVEVTETLSPCSVEEILDRVVGVAGQLAGDQ